MSDGSTLSKNIQLAGMLELVLDALEFADAIYEGSLGEKLASRGMEDGKYLVVVYRETDANDGFVITAFLTRRVYYLEKRKKLWP